jgi:hypothetical protein
LDVLDPSAKAPTISYITTIAGVDVVDERPYASTKAPIRRCQRG